LQNTLQIVGEPSRPPPRAQLIPKPHKNRDKTAGHPMRENQKAIAPKPLIFRTTHFWWLAPYSVVLAAAAVPRCQLGGDEDAVALSGSRLGWTTWLGGGPPHDRGDAMFAVG
jgi:hypothetical protein